jgi:hypothetical protein
LKFVSVLSTSFTLPIAVAALVTSVIATTAYMPVNTSMASNASTA